MAKKTFKICVVGAGQFAPCFIPLFQSHPSISEVSLADINEKRLKKESYRFKISKTFSSFENTIKSDIDAVAIFTQRWLHAPMAIKALKAGKHVYSAVPAGVNLNELYELSQVVQKTGLQYMMGETSYYMPSTIYCREQYKNGKFGRFVYGEGEYYHDMEHGFYDVFKKTHGKEWRKYAGFPPMLYPTHSVAMVLSVTGSKMTHVSCLGQVDAASDGVFNKKNLWKNPFSNQTALYRTSDGGMARVNEFRRIGYWAGERGNMVQMSLYGTKGCYEQSYLNACFSDKKGGIDLTKMMKCASAPSMNFIDEMNIAGKINFKKENEEFNAGYAPAHKLLPRSLPSKFKKLPNGHWGSHQYLVDDFVSSIVHQKTPAIDIHEAIKYTAPGIVAHESALKGGELLKISL